MLEKDEGIVLKATRSGETSQILTFLGRGTGKIRLMAKGALASKSPWRGLFEAGNHVEVVYYFKEGRTLFYIKEASSGSSPPQRRDSLPHLASLLAAMELLEQVCYSGSPDDHIVDVAIDYVRHPQSEDPLFVFLAFEIKLLTALGVAPDVSSCTHCGVEIGGGASFNPREGGPSCADHGGGGDAIPLSEEMIETIERCASEPFGSLACVDVSPATRKQLGKLVHWTYTHHVHGYSLPKSLNLI